MSWKRFFPVSLLLSAMPVLGCMIVPILEAQQPASPSASNPAAARIPYSPFLEIHVDDRCHILPDPDHPLPGKKPRPHTDPVICHLEGIASSAHMEESIVGHELRRNWIDITEQEYVLQNIAEDPVIFVVEQYVPPGWVVDSDPQPKQMSGQTAIFLANAKPGEIVHLHVGLRHTKPLRTKQIKAFLKPSVVSKSI